MTDHYSRLDHEAHVWLERQKALDSERARKRELDSRHERNIAAFILVSVIGLVVSVIGLILVATHRI